MKSAAVDRIGSATASGSRHIAIASTVRLIVPERYAAGLEMHCPGGALFQTGPCNPQHHFRSNQHAGGCRHMPTG
jgi:hypothetical protein